MSFVAPLMPFIMAGSAVLSGVQQMSASSYQAAVAANNASLAEQTAQRERHAAELDMQDRDLAARGQMGELMAAMDASGLTSTSGSMLRRSTSLGKAATIDRERLAAKRDIQFENTQRQAASYRADAKAARQAGAFSALSSILAVPTSYLSGAKMLNDYRGGRTTLLNPSYMGA